MNKETAARVKEIEIKIEECEKVIRLMSEPFLRLEFKANMTDVNVNDIGVENYVKLAYTVKKKRLEKELEDL